MLVIKSTNLAIRFLLELGVLAALGYWGFHDGKVPIVKVSLGIGLPILAAIFWGAFISPKASFLFPEPYRFILELIIFGIASYALFIANKPTLAIVLGVTFILNRILMMIWEQ